MSNLKERYIARQLECKNQLERAIQELKNYIQGYVISHDLLMNSIDISMYPNGFITIDGYDYLGFNSKNFRDDLLEVALNDALTSQGFTIDPHTSATATWILDFRHGGNPGSLQEIFFSAQSEVRKQYAAELISRIEEEIDTCGLGYDIKVSIEHEKIYVNGHEHTFCFNILHDSALHDTIHDALTPQGFIDAGDNCWCLN